MSRRNWLKLTGASTAAAVGGLTIGAAPVSATDGGPSDPENWSLVLEDQFEGSTLDTDNWDVGFGWGNDANGDDATVTADNVVVDNGTLRLLITHGGGGRNDVYQGAINSRNRQSFGPGHYFEARIRMPGREGLLPAFWGKPNTEDWPPEIDFVELFHDGGVDAETAHFNVHWSTSGQTNDESTHTHNSLPHYTGVDLTDSFNVYGCAWHEDSIDFYFNGEYVGSRDASSMMDAVNAGAPFYMMFTTHVNRIGNADLSYAWEEEMAVDWCRVWEYTPGDGDESVPEESEDEADGEPAVNTTGTATVGETSFEATGEVTDLGGRSRVERYIDYREVGAGDWEWVEAGSATSPGEFSAAVDDLESETEYEWFAAVWDADSDEELARGSVETVTTGEPDANDELRVSTVETTEVAETSFEAVGDLEGLGDEDEVTLYVDYREVGAGDWEWVEVGSATSPGEFSATVDGLESGTEYEWFAAAWDADSDEELVSGDVETVTTDAPDEPEAARISSVRTDNVGTTSFEAIGDLESLGEADAVNRYVDYREAGADEWQWKPVGSTSSPGEFSATLTRLEPGTVYEWFAAAWDADSDEELARGDVETVALEDGSD
ncbi:family 16 glycosylhydrolase [Natronolimnohabitans innermongolicus]|uniref:Subtilisin-like serine protease n=1 Tax=Natronolimnohabitans innermongolicus JCM 12255 TaxID=1227499 RepID=L9XJA5_9EURY|nr:family 16 glycosylhydrolase [Natronolimnohabitans innermongolicus]ELY60738.1 subtilisin-like serine protease [Natronolimnohabitans innermongolicus JCM 12255]